MSKPDELQEKRTEKTLREILDNIDEHPFGIITQKGYKELSNQIHRWIVWSMVFMALIGLTSAIALVGFAVYLDNQGELTRQIQEQRFNSFLQSCEEQNVHHDRAIEKSMKVLDPNAQKAVRSLVDELQPKVDDCKAYAQDRVDGTGP